VVAALSRRCGATSPRRPATQPPPQLDLLPSLCRALASSACSLFVHAHDANTTGYARPEGPGVPCSPTAPHTLLSASARRSSAGPSSSVRQGSRSTARSRCSFSVAVRMTVRISPSVRGVRADDAQAQGSRAARSVRRARRLHRRRGPRASRTRFRETREGRYEVLLGGDAPRRGT
jgi:hypothetical protein